MAIKTITLPIKGMSCSSCSRSVEKQLENLEGLVEKHVDYASAAGEFSIDDTKISTDELIQVINKGHYKVDLPGEVHLPNETKEIIPCPVCDNIGQDVPITVLRSNLKAATYKQTNLEDEFFICMTPSCDVAYYTSKDEQIIDKSALKRELYYKEGTENEIICYCNNVDRGQIEDTVLNHGVFDWDGTMARYSNKVQEKCEILNPTGLCCRGLFDEVVEEIKELNPLIVIH